MGGASFVYSFVESYRCGMMQVLMDGDEKLTLLCQLRGD